MKWFTEGDEETQIKYIGEVKDGVPHGQGAEFFGSIKFYHRYYNGGVPC